MFHACVVRFDVIENFEKFLFFMATKQGLSILQDRLDYQSSLTPACMHLSNSRQQMSFVKEEPVIPC
jgi:hypothetical protein